MKRMWALLSIATILMANTTNAQDKWEAVYNNKVIHKGTADADDVITVPRVPHLKTTDVLTLRYHTENSDNTWKRTFYINDAGDQVLKTVEMNNQSGSVRISNAFLRKLIAKKEPVTLYTSSIPKDQLKAATVRVRRMMLCKIEWK